MFHRLIVALAVLLGSLGQAPAETYPSRTVTMIVPFAAGGPTDALARILAQAMSTALKQSVVIENVPGAGGATGAQRLIRTPADGYTIMMSDLALPAAPLLNDNVKYDLARDFATLGVVNAGPMVLISRPGLTDGNLFALIRERADTLNLGHSGRGSNSHMCGLLVQQALGARMTEVPYRGAGPAMNDMLAGSLDVMCEQSTTAIPQIDGGKVVAHGVTSRTRLDVLPNVQTLAEGGLPDFDFTVWHGLYAPSGTPADAVATLNQALREALAQPSVRDHYARAGRTEFPVELGSPQAHAEMLAKEQQRLRTALDRAGVTPKN